MRVVLLTAAIVVIVALTVFGSSTLFAIRSVLDIVSGQEPTAVAIFDSTSIDLGLVKPNELLTARFQISNAGGKRLIVRLQSDCQCSSHQPLIIPPMKTADLLLPIDARRLAELPQRTMCTTNDPNLPEVLLTVHGRLPVDSR